MHFFESSPDYRKQLHMIYLKAQRNPATSVQFEIDKIADDDEALATELKETYFERYGYPSDVVAKEGYVYLMKASGFYGVAVPILGRYKIGKSNNPKRRHVELNGQQAACPVELIRYIQIDDMGAVEAALHKQFKSSRKHGEWFDFWVWQLPLVHLAYSRYQSDFRVNKLARLPKAKAIALNGGVILALLLISTLFFSSLLPPQPSPVPTFQKKEQKR